MAFICYVVPSVQSKPSLRIKDERGRRKEMVSWRGRPLKNKWVMSDCLRHCLRIYNTNRRIVHIRYDKIISFITGKTFRVHCLEAISGSLLESPDVIYTD